MDRLGPRSRVPAFVNLQKSNRQTPAEDPGRRELSK